MPLLLLQFNWKWDALCVGVSTIHPIRDKFPPFFENVVLGSIKFLFQLDHQVDISPYLTEVATLCSKVHLSLKTKNHMHSQHRLKALYIQGFFVFVFGWNKKYNMYT